MNCPHRHRIFEAEPRSYRDLPLRLAEYGMCYRYEQSGELFGTRPDISSDSIRKAGIFLQHASESAI